jgi:hypothetical protein
MRGFYCVTVEAGNSSLHSLKYRILFPLFTRVPYTFLQSIAQYLLEICPILGLLLLLHMARFWGEPGFGKERATKLDYCCSQRAFHHEINMT